MRKNTINIQNRVEVALFQSPNYFNNQSKFYQLHNLLYKEHLKAKQKFSNSVTQSSSNHSNTTNPTHTRADNSIHTAVRS